MLSDVSKYWVTLKYVKANPAAHPLSIFIAALTPLYRTLLVNSGRSGAFAANTNYGDAQACSHALGALRSMESTDRSDEARTSELDRLAAEVFPDMGSFGTCPIESLL